MAIITVVTEDGLAEFDTDVQRVVEREPQRQKCHCEREPMNVWLCCLAAGSTCECQQTDQR
jgi:hypothetical protein